MAASFGFEYDFEAAAAAMPAMTMTRSVGDTTVISIPQWVIDLHEFRRRVFLRTIEPVVELILGPAAEAAVEQDASTAMVDAEHRRLNFVPSYVEDVSYLRANSMTFATLTMMLVIMSIISLVFLSCFYHNQKTAPLFVSPRRHRLPNLVPPPLPVNGPFSWVKVCLFISDEEVSYGHTRNSIFHCVKT
jgi:hypothetical protein